MKQDFIRTFRYDYKSRDQATRDAQDYILRDFEACLRYGFTANGTDFYDGLVHHWCFGPLKNVHIKHIETALLEDVEFSHLCVDQLRMTVYFDP